MIEPRGDQTGTYYSDNQNGWTGGWDTNPPLVSVTCPVCGCRHEDLYDNRWVRFCEKARRKGHGSIARARMIFSYLMEPYRIYERVPPPETNRRKLSCKPWLLNAAPRPWAKTRSLRPSIRSRLRREWRPKGKRGKA